MQAGLPFLVSDRIRADSSHALLGNLIVDGVSDGKHFCRPSVRNFPSLGSASLHTATTGTNRCCSRRAVSIGVSKYKEQHEETQLTETVK